VLALERCCDDIAPERARARRAHHHDRRRQRHLRHSHASLLIDLGAHPKAISERMGHSEIGVTMNVYGHLFDGKQRELTTHLDDLLGRTRSKPPANHGSEPIPRDEDDTGAG
jgi:integrase